MNAAYGKDRFDEERMELGKSHFVRLIERDTQFFARVGDIFSQRNGGEVQASLQPDERIGRNTFLLADFRQNNGLKSLKSGSIFIVLGSDFL